MFFDLGVYLIVVGLVLDVLRSLGARVDVEMGRAATAVVSAMTAYLVPLVLIGGLTSVGRLPAAGTQSDTNVAGAVADRQRDQPVDPHRRRPVGQPTGARAGPATAQTTTADPLAQGMILTAIVISMGIAGVRAGAGIPVVPADHRGGGQSTIPKTPASRSCGEGGRRLDEDRPHLEPATVRDIGRVPGRARMR